MTPAELDEIKNEAGRDMHAVLDEARASPWPQDRLSYTDVQDTHGQGLVGSA